MATVERRVSRRAIGLGVGLVAINAVVASAWPAARLTLVIENASFVGPCALASVACASSARRSVAPWRAGWWLLSVTAGLWTVANFGWAWSEVVLQRPVGVPSWTDLVYLPAQASAVAAMFVFLRPLARERGSWARAAVDGALILAALFQMLRVVLFATSVESAVGSLGRAVAIAYPVTDVLLVTVALLLLARAPRDATPVALALGASLLLVAIGDGLWAFEVLAASDVGKVLSVVTYVGGYLLLATAASLRLGKHPDLAARGPRWARAVLFAPLAGGVVFFLAHELTQSFGDVIGATLVAMLFVRTVFAIQENANLNRTLEMRVAERTSDLAASEALFRTMANTVSDAVVIIGADGKTRFVSAGLQHLDDWDTAIVEGGDLLRFVHPDDLPAAMSLLDGSGGEPGTTSTVRVRLVADGGMAVADATLKNLTNDPSIDGYMLVLRDVTEQDALEQRLRHRADHDELTDLGNRSLMQERLETDFAAGRAPSLVRLDLDGFKAFNDELGPRVGDAMLVEIAMRLRGCVSEADLLARTGGDEFAVVVDDPSAALDVANAIHVALDQLIRVGDRGIRCQASIGVATFGDDPRSLMRNADLAMQEAKADGKGHVETFRRSMLLRVERRNDLVTGLASAIDNHELRLVYQPVVDILSGDVLGAEALLRWHRADEQVDPEEFIAIAEETGLIGAIGRWALEHACSEAARWQLARPDGYPPCVAVNVSAVQLVEHDLVDDVTAALAHSGLAPECLTIELTESTLMEDSDTILERLHELKALGVRLSIDDFGTGYSSLGRLRFLPVDEVKIDQSFVSHVASVDDPMPVVEAVFALARSMHLDVVAEGVEDLVQLAALRARGCRRAQGYLLGRPMSPEALVGLLDTGVEVDNMTLKFSV